MEPLIVLEKASEIIKLANEDYIEFANEYQEGLIGMGEREVDFALYAIDLSDDYLLVILASDYSVDDFEIKSKHVQKKLLSDKMLEILYP